MEWLINLKVGGIPHVVPHSLLWARTFQVDYAPPPTASCGAPGLKCHTREGRYPASGFPIESGMAVTLAAGVSVCSIQSFVTTLGSRLRSNRRSSLPAVPNTFIVNAVAPSEDERRGKALSDPLVKCGNMMRGRRPRLPVPFPRKSMSAKKLLRNGG
jgi:hypothetical protein